VQVSERIGWKYDSYVKTAIVRIELQTYGSYAALCTMELCYYMYVSWNHIPLHEEVSVNNVETNFFSHLGNAVGQCLTIEHCTNRCFWNLQELYVVKGELSF